MLDTVQTTIATALEENPEKGVFRVARNIFTDPELLELEMKHVFEGNWIYLAHESQIPNKNDYFTTTMGRQPIFIARNRNGELNAFINACSHRGAMLCRHKRANKATFTCPFHGWTFNNSGKLLKVKDPEGAGYPEDFNKDGSYDLKTVPRFESYRGFLFGSLNPDVLPLKEHLGEAAKIIDMIVDQAPEGHRGAARLFHLHLRRQLEAADRERRRRLPRERGALELCGDNRPPQGGLEQVDKSADDAGGWAKQGGGFYSFEHGHLLLWTKFANPEFEPNVHRRDESSQRLGEARADWIVEQLPQPVPVPERVPDGPVQHADPHLSADRGR